MTLDAIDRDLRDLLDAVLGLGAARIAALTADSALFGALPELDSMALATLFGAIEDRFDLFLADDEIDGAVVATYGSLLAFLRARMAA